MLVLAFENIQEFGDQMFPEFVVPILKIDAGSEPFAIDKVVIDRDMAKRLRAIAQKTKDKYNV